MRHEGNNRNKDSQKMKIVTKGDRNFFTESIKSWVSLSNDEMKLVRALLLITVFSF